MAEKASAATERELVALRRSLDRDIDLLISRARADSDPRRWIRRNPAAAAGALGSAGAILTGLLARRGRGAASRKGAPLPPARDRLTDALVTAAGTALTTVAARAAKRFATRLFEDRERG